LCSTSHIYPKREHKLKVACVVFRLSLLFMIIWL